MGKIVRDQLFKCLLAIGDVGATKPSHNYLFKMTKVLEKMKNSFLILLQSDVNADLDAFAFKTETLVITGKYFQ